MIAEIAPEGPGFEKRSGLIFLANFDNLANSDAATWFLREIWPILRRALPEMTLGLVGNNLPDNPEVPRPWNRSAWIRPGSRARVCEVSRCRVSRAFGTGIKTKNLLALANAVPLVTTTVGADGMNLVNGESALIADTPEEFAKAIVHALHRWPSVAQTFQARATTHCRRIQRATHAASGARRLRDGADDRA